MAPCDDVHAHWNGWQIEPDDHILFVVAKFWLLM